MANTVSLRLDAENKQIILEVVDASTGSVVTSWGQVILKLGQDPGTVPSNPGHAMGQPLALLETEGCDPDTGDPKFCMMLRSPWYDTALTSNPRT